MSKDIILTNWQVPRDPSMKPLDDLRQALESNPLNIDNYQNVGSVEHHENTETVVEKMICKQEVARGQKIDKEVQADQPINMNGIVDNRNKSYWKP